jgi:hypothetical protein
MRKPVFLLGSALGLLCLSSIAAAQSANDPPPTTCDPTGGPPSLIQCPVDSYPMLTTTDEEDLCETPEPVCEPIDAPPEVRLDCVYEGNDAVCTAMPQTVDSKYLPVLYLWRTTYKQLSPPGPPTPWTASAEETFSCGSSINPLRTVEVTVMSPYGLTASASVPVSCP